MGTREEIIEIVDDLKQEFSVHAYLLFAMGLRLGTEDYKQLKRDNLLDSYDDKKIDFLHIDFETGCAIVAQSYQNDRWDDVHPLANKASDLNTALNWLLDSDLETITFEPVRVAATQLRDGLESGEIHTVEFYFVHNTQESTNVNTELNTVQAGLQTNLDLWAAKSETPIVGVAKQFSLVQAISSYDLRYSSISISDEITLTTISAPVENFGPQWKAVYTTIAGGELTELVNEYGDDLFSANIRDYLGKRASSRNINNQMSQTAIDQPENFWAFNNGVTLISRKVEALSNSVVCRGVAVINGAQTLGALHEAAKKGSIDGVTVLVRIVESTESSVIEDIIRFNNTQNPIKPWELRGLDPTQDRIKQDFEKKHSLTYQFRRGVGRRGSNDILSEKLGPWINSF